MNDRHHTNSQSTPNRRPRALTAMLAMAIVALAAGEAGAACGAGERISHTAAACLEVETRAATLTEPAQYQVDNACVDYGTVAAQVDFANGTSISHALTTDAALRANAPAAVENIWCCSEDGDLCNIADLVSPASCVSEFERSSAGASCTNATATINADYTCLLAADCVIGVDDIRITRTVADLARSERVEGEHLAEALSYQCASLDGSRVQGA